MNTDRIAIGFLLGVLITAPITLLFLRLPIWLGLIISCGTSIIIAFCIVLPLFVLGDRVEDVMYDKEKEARQKAYENYIKAKIREHPGYPLEWVETLYAADFVYEKEKRY